MTTSASSGLSAHGQTAPPAPSAAPAAQLAVPHAASLEVIRAELDRVQGSCETRTNGVDTKAGLILATAGVLIGFHADNPTIWDRFAAPLALTAGGLAIYAFHPRPGRTVSPETLYQAHLNDPSIDVLHEMIKGRIHVWKLDEASLTTKAKRMFWAILALAAAGFLYVVSSVTSIDAGPSPISPPAASTQSSTATAASTSPSSVTTPSSTTPAPSPQAGTIGPGSAARTS